MLNKVKNKMKPIIMFTTLLIFNIINFAYASAPSKNEVENIAVNGIKMFFGALAGIAVVMGGIEFWGAFLAYREDLDEGGSAEANSRIGRKIVAGVLCLIAAVIAFTVMNWTLTLFNLD